MASLESYRSAGLTQLAQRVKSVTETGGIVALPTETFYGFGVNPFDERAVDRLLRLKGRGNDKPILVLIGAVTQLSLLTEGPSPVAALLMDAFWPGPLTILFSARSALPRNLTAGTGMIGVRLSPYFPLIEILRVVGPLTGTSANRSGEKPAETPQRVMQSFGDAIDLVLDVGPTAGGMPSTVIDPREPVRLIREGAVTRQMIENVLQTQGISLM